MAVLTLMLGVTAGCITGTWMALKRVHLDYRRLKRLRQAPHQASIKSAP